jgi:hypothetical protein
MKRSISGRPVPGQFIVLLFLAAVPMLVACSTRAPPAPATSGSEAASTVTLTAEEAAKLGVATAPSRATLFSPRSAGYGMVVSLETVAQIFAELKTAAAAASQSSAAATRARTLAGGDEAAVSQEALEGAQSKALADEAALSLAQRKADATFGREAPWRTDAERDRVLHTLATGRAALVRVTFPAGALGATKPASIRVSRIGTYEPGWSTPVIWPAPADPAAPGTGFYGLLDGSSLAQGEHVTAWTGVGAALTGVWIPQGAILLSESDTWVYVQVDANRFRRVRVDITHPDRDGYFIQAGAGVAPGQRVVVGGAGLLLARELNPGNGSGD